MQMPIPDDWDGESFCRWAVCWPDSIMWKSILYGLIEQPNQGRFWDFRTGNFLTLRSQFKTAYDYNFSLKGVIMACEDTGIADGLLAIASALSQMAVNQANNNQVLNQIALSNNICCEQTLINTGGNVVANITTPEGETTPIYGTQPPLSIVDGEFPEGYEDLEEYELDKCQMANLIFDGWLLSLRNIAAFGVFNGIALAGLVVAAIAGAIIFPPAAIPIMCAAIGMLAVNVTILAVVADELEANRDYWVCILYQSDSVEQIVALIADALDILIASLQTTGTIGTAIKLICLTLLNSDTLNGLMEKRAHQDYPNADCSMCVDCEVWVQAGSEEKILQETPTFIEIQSTENAPTWHFVLINFNVIEPGVPCGGLVTIEATGLTGWTARASNDYQLFNDGGLFYTEAVIWTHPAEHIRGFIVNSSTAFTLTMTISQEE